MSEPELCVAFACDTEDNHPNYVPGWTKYGSNYEKNPALVNWNWTKYWSDLSKCFSTRNVPVTWLTLLWNLKYLTQIKPNYYFVNYVEVAKVVEVKRSE